MAPSGILYVADWNNYRIRAISPSADVTNLAGSGASSLADGDFASFVHPLNVFADSLNVYVLDSDAHALRAVSLTSGAMGRVSTIAGGGSPGYANGFGTNALFNFPAAASADSMGTIFVSDYNNNRIRQLTCVPCPASYYCSTGIPVICPAGSYCPFNPPADNLTPCPAGTWSAAAGASSNSTCTSCAAGTYSVVSGAAAPSTCTPCVAGTFSISAGANAPSACTPCPSGTYSPAGATSCKYTVSTCPIGTFAVSPASEQPHPKIVHCSVPRGLFLP